MLKRASRFSENILYKGLKYDYIYLLLDEQVTFVGEGAIEDGGPRLEFFRLLVDAAVKNYLKGVRGGTGFQHQYHCCFRFKS